MKKLLLALMILTVSLGASAKIRGLNNYSEALASDIFNIQGELEAASDSPMVDSANGTNWYLNVFRIETTISAGFSIPGIASITVIPYLELHWKRDLPANFQAYVPGK